MRGVNLSHFSAPKLDQELRSVERQQLTSPPCELLWFESDRALARAVAADWLGVLREASAALGATSVALSGGRIAQTFFRAACDVFSAQRGLLEHVHFFWADERCVPPSDPESNYRIAAELLFGPLGVGDENIHRIIGEMHPSEAARRAGRELANCAAATSARHPRLDLVFIGMGEDGHIASLFPDEPDAAANSPDLFRAVTASKPPPKRVTMGYGVLADARKVWVLASGKGKHEALRNSLLRDGRTPLGRLLASRRDTRVYTDLSASTVFVR